MDLGFVHEHENGILLLLMDACLQEIDQVLPDSRHLHLCLQRQILSFPSLCLYPNLRSHPPTGWRETLTGARSASQSRSPGSTSEPASSHNGRDSSPCFLLSVYIIMWTEVPRRAFLLIDAPLPPHRCPVAMPYHPLQHPRRPSKCQFRLKPCEAPPPRHVLAQKVVMLEGEHKPGLCHHGVEHRKRTASVHEACSRNIMMPSSVQLQHLHCRQLRKATHQGD